MKQLGRDQDDAPEIGRGECRVLRTMGPVRGAPTVDPRTTLSGSKISLAQIRPLKNFRSIPKRERTVKNVGLEPYVSAMADSFFFHVVKVNYCIINNYGRRTDKRVCLHHLCECEVWGLLNDNGRGNEKS